MHTLTEQQWREIFSEPGLVSPTMQKIFNAIYLQPNHEGYAGELGRTLGYRGKNTSAPLNTSVGKLGKKLLDKYDIEPHIRSNGKPSYWRVIFDGEQGEKYFLWRMRPELAAAFSTNYDIIDAHYSDEIAPEQAEYLPEGACKKVTVNYYERNPHARRRCIEHYGTGCSVCNFDFSEVYGNLGENYTHVHHLVPLETVGKNYKIDPIKDLRPVCPNCHAMLHKNNPPFSIEYLRNTLKKQK